MEADFTFEVLYGSVLLFLLTAVFGSVLTISSVLYAKRNKKYNFDNDEWLKSTIFILNVALVDIVYCTFVSAHSFYAFLIYLQYRFEDTSSACKFFVLGSQNLACISGWSIAMTAFSGSFPKYRYMNFILTSSRRKGQFS